MEDKKESIHTGLGKPSETRSASTNLARVSDRASAVLASIANALSKEDHGFCSHNIPSLPRFSEESIGGLEPINIHAT